MHSYSKVKALTHKTLEGLWDGPVVIQEKVDGCFPYDTPIAIANGAYKEIGEIVAGTEVLTWDRELAISRVTGLRELPTDDYWAVVVLADREIVCTGNHRFFTSRGWVAAEDLTTEDIVFTPNNGVLKPMVVMGVEWRAADAGEKKYDLEVEGTHNFFARDILVHNSQFSFSNVDGRLVARSKRTTIYIPDKIFKVAYDYALSQLHLLHPGWTYRAEAVCSPKQNTLTYSRAAKNGIVLFDIDKGEQDYLSQEEVEKEAKRLGVDYAPVFDVLRREPKNFDKYLDRESVLGGTLVEGVVIKNYNEFGPDGKVLMGKVVRPEFREMNENTWKAIKASPVEILIEKYRTEARWKKAIQHLREEGVLVNAPQDISSLMREIALDVFNENAEEIKEELFNRYWGDISRGIVKGFPVWYKERLDEGEE